MLKSKYFLVMAILTFVALGAGLAFNVMEMLEYDLFTTLQERFFK